VQTKIDQDRMTDTDDTDDTQSNTGIRPLQTHTQDQDRHSKRRTEAQARKETETKTERGTATAKGVNTGQSPISPDTHTHTPEGRTHTSATHLSPFMPSTLKPKPQLNPIYTQSLPPKATKG
jgi:hypothetical protein